MKLRCVHFVTFWTRHNILRTKWDGIRTRHFKYIESRISTRLRIWTKKIIPFALKQLAQQQIQSHLLTKLQIAHPLLSNYRSLSSQSKWQIEHPEILLWLLHDWVHLLWMTLILLQYRPTMQCWTWRYCWQPEYWKFEYITQLCCFTRHRITFLHMRFHCHRFS